MPLTDITQLISSAGICGIFVVLIISGYLVPKGAAEYVLKQAEAWRAAYESSDRARVEAGAALATERQRADAQVEVAAILRQMLEEARSAPQTRQDR